jgi:hypothetical protein
MFIRMARLFDSVAEGRKFQIRLSHRLADLCYEGHEPSFNNDIWRRTYSPVSARIAYEYVEDFIDDMRDNFT